MGPSKKRGNENRGWGEKKGYIKKVRGEFGEKKSEWGDGRGNIGMAGRGK